MNYGVDKLIESLTNYYGQYENQFVKKMVIGWLKSKVKEEEFKKLLQVIYSYHKANFNAPCIATIKECIDKARLKDNTYEPYKIKTTNTEVYNYRDLKQEIPKEELEENKNKLTSMFKDLAKNKK